MQQSIDISCLPSPQQQIRSSLMGQTDRRTPDSCVDRASHRLRAVPITYIVPIPRTFLTCSSTICSDCIKSVFLFSRAHSEVVVLGISAVSAEVGQVNAQSLTCVRRQPVKIVVACTIAHLLVGNFAGDMNE